MGGGVSTPISKSSFRLLVIPESWHTMNTGRSVKVIAIPAERAIRSITMTDAPELLTTSIGHQHHGGVEQIMTWIRHNGITGVRGNRVDCGKKAVVFTSAKVAVEGRVFIEVRHILC